MRITDLLHPQSIALGLAMNEKTAAIHALVGLMARAGNLSDPDAFERDVLAREAEGSTDVGGGIAIPHAKSAAVRRAGVAAVTLAGGIPAAQGEPVRLLFLIAAPQGSDNEHVQMLSRLAMLLMEPGFGARLLAARTPQEFLDVVAAQEEQDQARSEARHPRPSRTTYKLLAVTACPSGIAHTYMAAEALNQAARELEVSLKVETNGASGVGNALTPEEITAASCIIVAADKAVDIARFAGKPVLKVPVTAAVRTPRELLQEALSGMVPRLPAEGEIPPWSAPPARRRSRLEGRLHDGYTHLMSGISHMLPFVTGGGLLIAFSYLLGNLGVSKNITWMMKSVGEQAFALMYPILSGFIALSMGGAPAFVPGVLGGWLAQTGMTVQPEQYWTSSGFWGTLAAGFAAGLLMRGLARLGKNWPKALDQAKVTLLYPATGAAAIGFLMVFVINPPLSRFNSLIYQLLNNLNGGSRLVLAVVLGALMATDYGGPINKAAYVFGTIALMNDQYDIMAAVMIGGMAPPVGVALACLFFPDRFTGPERRTVPQNLLLGASFVTEGALPFALKDPLRVIPACCVGSGVAGGLCMQFGCGCPAPHGGLFLLPVMIHPLRFMLALLAGAAVTAFLLGISKRRLPDQPPDPPPDTEVPGK